MSNRSSDESGSHFVISSLEAELYRIARLQDRRGGELLVTEPMGMTVFTVICAPPSASALPYAAPERHRQPRHRD